MKHFPGITRRKDAKAARPDTAGHPAHYTASNRPHSPPGAGSVRTAATASRNAARAAARTATRRTPATAASTNPTSTRPTTQARMRTAPRVQPHPDRQPQRTQNTQNTQNTRTTRNTHNERHNRNTRNDRSPRPSRSIWSTRSPRTPHNSHRPHRSRYPQLLRSTTPLTPLSILSLLGIFAVVLTLLFYGTAAAKGGKPPSLTAAGAAPAQAPDPTPTPAAPPGAHGPPTKVSPAQANSSTGIQYRRDNERDPGREKDKDRNQARRCTRAAPGAPSPYRRPVPPHPYAARSYPIVAFFPSHTGTAATFITARPGVAARPALHCLHCVFRC